MSELERLAARDRPPIEDRLTATLHDYWHERVAMHFDDSYAGVAMYKFPEDLRVYEHLLWYARPNVVIEVGAQYGGSALWFRDRLRTLSQYGLEGRPRVIAIDHTPEVARPNLDAADPQWAESIELIGADVTDPALGERVGALIEPGDRCMVVEDCEHNYATTSAALASLARFVAPGGFFVVEDGCVDVEAMRGGEDWPRGVLPAVADFLDSDAGADFRRRRDLELYGVTCHPGGYLQRRD